MAEFSTGLSKQELAQESITWAARARDLKIVDGASCVNASHFLRSVKGLRAEIAGFFAPHINAAMETKRKAEEARKALADEKDKMEAQLVEAEAVVKRALLTYENEQERLRKEHERQLQAEAQRQAEALTLEAAAALELEANATGDEAMRQEAEDILAQPITAPAVSVAKMMPKVEGVTYRDSWKAHPTVDVRALAGAVAAGTVSPNLLTPNMTALNQMARATQGSQDVPGVRFFNDRQVAARG